MHCKYMHAKWHTASDAERKGDGGEARGTWNDRERAYMREREGRQSGEHRQGQLKEGLLYDCMQQTMVRVRRRGVAGGG